MLSPKNYVFTTKTNRHQQKMRVNISHVNILALKTHHTIYILRRHTCFLVFITFILCMSVHESWNYNEWQTGTAYPIILCTWVSREYGLLRRESLLMSCLCFYFVHVSFPSFIRLASWHKSIFLLSGPNTSI